MKKYLIAGLIILLPVALTGMVLVFLFDLFTAPFVTLVSLLINFIQTKFSFNLPTGVILFFSRLLSLILISLFIFFLGVITQLIVVRSLINWADKLMFRIPFIRTIYRLSQDIFSALFSTGNKKAFKYPVKIPFPSKPNYCLGFIAGEVAKECQSKVSTPLLSIFAPTAPHPVSGFLFLAPESDVERVNMSSEEVIKFLVSCGMIVPESDHPND